MSLKSILIIATILVAVHADLVYLSADATAKCPKYACDSTAGDACANGKGKMTETRTVTVNPCKDTKVCPLNPFAFYNDVDTKIDCVEPAKTDLNALPGEACKVDADCQKITYYPDTGDKTVGFQKCTANKCVGSNETKGCANHESCMLGLYCKKTTDADGTCQKQLAKDAVCTATLECLNNLACNDGKCAETFSLKNGDTVKLPTAEAGGERIMCASGNATSGRCSTTKYDAEAHKNVSSGLVTCDFGTKCKYTIYFKDDGSDKTAGTDQDCFCTLSADGQGYCPYASGDSGNSSLVSRVITMAKSNFDGQHTAHRFNDKPGNEANSSVCQLWAGAVASKGALDCVKTAFGATKCAANYISTAIAALMMVFFALF